MRTALLVPISILVSNLALSSAHAQCPPGEPAGCCASPPIAATLACDAGTRQIFALSTIATPNARQFAVTSQHAVWADSNGGPVKMYYTTHGGTCTAPPAALAIAGTDAVETADASIKIGTTSSRIYVDRGGAFTNLDGFDIPGGAPVSLLPAPAPSDRRAPGSTEGAGLAGFVWEQANDIYACTRPTCTAAQIVQVTNTSDIERGPRIAKNLRATWQNNTTGQIQYADLTSLPIVVHNVDTGFRPDINSDWIVYSKWESNPVGGCLWTQHAVLWAYGPLSGSPVATRIAPGPNVGAANYIAVRLTDNYLLSAVNYIYESKTVLALTSVASFDLAPTPEYRELTDTGDAYTTNIDLYENTATDNIFATFRSHSTHGAALACCASSY